MNMAVSVSLLLACCGLAMLALSGLGSEAHSRQALLMQARRMNMVPLSQTEMLCEGHFIDTATGVPDVPFSTLHHPAELPGYVEPLPPDMRAAIDAKVYSDLVSASAESSPQRVLRAPGRAPLPFVCAVLMASRCSEQMERGLNAMLTTRVPCSQDPEKFQFAGCIDPLRVSEVKTAVGTYRNEHASLAHFAAGHDYPFPHGQWLVSH